MNRSLLALAAWAAIALSTAPALSQPLSIKPLAEKKVASLPSGPLYWRIETFAVLGEAQRSAGEWSLTVESAGKAWLFTLGAPGGATPGASKVAELGPIAPLRARQFLLRINEARGAPGSTTSVHTHPGSEAFFVLAGEQTIRGARGVLRIGAGQAEPGSGADIPMQVSSSGSTDLHALVMFVVDAERPFSSPASWP